MGFDLLGMLGVSVTTALAIVGGGIAVAALLALRLAWRQRAAATSRTGLRLDEGSRRSGAP